MILLKVDTGVGGTQAQDDYSGTGEFSVHSSTAQSGRTGECSFAFR